MPSVNAMERCGIILSWTHDDHARRTGPALEARQQFILWLVQTVEKFPRSQKFLLGDRCGMPAPSLGHVTAK
jgi:hypothetical protein